MSIIELGRLAIVLQVLKKAITQSQAAKNLSVSERQLRRLLKTMVHSTNEYSCS